MKIMEVEVMGIITVQCLPFGVLIVGKILLFLAVQMEDLNFGKEHRAVLRYETYADHAHC